MVREVLHRNVPIQLLTCSNKATEVSRLRIPLQQLWPLNEKIVNEVTQYLTAKRQSFHAANALDKHYPRFEEFDESKEIRY